MIFDHSNLEAYQIDVEVEPGRWLSIGFLGKEVEGLPQPIIYNSDLDQVTFERVMVGACTHDGYLLNVKGEMQPSDLISAISSKGLNFKVVKQPSRVRIE